MYDVNTTDVRQFFAHVWQKRYSPQTLDPLSQKALRIIMAHPEYESYLSNIEDYLNYNWSPELGESNPFLHLSLHLSIQEQVSIDQPFGIARIYQSLLQKHQNWLDAEHEMMDALGETIWEAQHYGKPLDMQGYVEKLKKLI